MIEIWATSRTYRQSRKYPYVWELSAAPEADVLASPRYTLPTDLDAAISATAWKTQRRTGRF